MADIKAGSSGERGIRSVSHKGKGAFRQARRVRHDYIKTKEYLAKRQEKSEESAENYAAGQVSEKGYLLVKRGAAKAGMARKMALHLGKGRFIKRRGAEKKAGIPGKESAKAGKKAGLIGQGEKKPSRHTASKSSKLVALARPACHAGNSVKSIHRAKMTEEAAKQTAVTASIALKRMAASIAIFVKSFAAGVKSLAAAIFAGGWVAIVIVLVVVVLGAAVTFFGNQESSCIPVSEEVEQYDPLIRKYAEMHGIAEYVDLVKAVMMQESAGKGTDPMQASECGFNKKYPNTPDGITDPEYSINVGIENLAACIGQAGVKSPVDIDNIKLALQGYNFGNGFISWAKEKHGGYSGAAAREFSAMMAKRNGWSSYGDIDYVAHVMRYYPYSSYSLGMVFYSKGILGLPIEGMTKADVTSPFGGRPSPGGIGSTNHKGTDFGFPAGTPVYACESGTVVHAGLKGGYGKCVIIDHGNGIQTLYAHQSRLNVAAGQRVVRGQCIGAVGSTGNSTGPHLHLEVRVNGVPVDPMNGYLDMP